MIKTLIFTKFMAVIISILVLSVLGFFSYEARNEIYYLCGNFKHGIPHSSVIRQLNTSNLSSFRIETSESRKKIVHSSPLHFHLIRCEIDFNQDKKVLEARYWRVS